MDDLQDCWSRTVMFDNVPPDSFSDLWMFVNNRQFGGIESESFKEDPVNKRVLVTFVDKNGLLLLQSSHQCKDADYIIS